jgi:hypothetical protein
VPATGVQAGAAHLQGYLCGPSLNSDSCGWFLWRNTSVRRKRGKVLTTRRRRGFAGLTRCTRQYNASLPAGAALHARAPPGEFYRCLRAFPAFWRVRRESHGAARSRIFRRYRKPCATRSDFELLPLLVSLVSAPSRSGGVSNRLRPSAIV